MTVDHAELITFKGFGKTFSTKAGDLRAATDINLAIGQGEFVTLVGPSGCGKSTLLNAAAGLFPPTDGQVLYRGRPVAGYNHSVGYMTQSDHLLPWRDVVGNIAVPLEIKGMGRREIADRVSELVTLVGLKGFEKSYPTQLSGGMRKRAALARLLAYDPDTLLMDEPFGALDAMTRQGLQDEVLSLVRASDATVIFVTHDLEEAIYLGDRVIGLLPHPGRIGIELKIDLPRRRDQLTTRENPEFLALRRELFDFIKASET